MYTGVEMQTTVIVQLNADQNLQLLIESVDILPSQIQVMSAEVVKKTKILTIMESAAGTEADCRAEELLETK